MGQRRVKRKNGKKKKIQLPGCNRHNISKPSKQDLLNIRESFKKWYEEYKKLSLEKLRKIDMDSLSSSKKSALDKVIEFKLLEDLNKQKKEKKEEAEAETE